MALIACISAPMLTVNANAATPTGFTKADDVEYQVVTNYYYSNKKNRVNWGVRDEACTFLSTYAEAFYTGSYEYSILSEVDGGSSQTNAPQSALYKSLQTLMKSKHTKETNYQETRYMYRYTDCEAGDYNTISSFYSKKSLSGVWDSGSTWNREHTWPNSKGLAGNDENDIMMLRPTSVSENSSRGNKAYGESSGYYNPGKSVHGDCARIVLYTYVRWGNTSYMWGSGGVMENLNVLLDWMEEDPVDTWEMGRNDAVQYITGTRNVFVDYPEYAWLLFGREIPETLTTPSGNAANAGTPDVPDTPDEPDTPDTPDQGDSSKPSEVECEHEYSRWFVTTEPTDTANGERWRFCKKCNVYEKEVLPMTGGGDQDKNEEESVSEGGDANALSNCNSSIVSPFAVTLLLAGAYVFLRKK